MVGTEARQMYLKQKKLYFAEQAPICIEIKIPKLTLLDTGDFLTLVV